MRSRLRPNGADRRLRLLDDNCPACSEYIRRPFMFPATQSVLDVEDGRADSFRFADHVERLHALGHDEGATPSAALIENTRKAMALRREQMFDVAALALALTGSQSQQPA